MSLTRFNLFMVVRPLCLVVCCCLLAACRFGQERVDFEVVVDERVVKPMLVEGVGEEPEAHYTITELGAFLLQDDSNVGRDWGKPRWIIDGALAGRDVLNKTVYTLREEERVITMCRKNPHGKDVCVHKYVTTDVGGTVATSRSVNVAPGAPEEDTSSTFQEASDELPSVASIDAPLWPENADTPSSVEARRDPEPEEPAWSFADRVAPRHTSPKPAAAPDVSPPSSSPARATTNTSSSPPVHQPAVEAPAPPPAREAAPAPVLAELSRALTVGPKLSDFTPSCGEFLEGP